MNRARLVLLLLIPWVLVSCSAGRLGREAAEGGFDAAREFLNSPEADRLIDEKVERGVDAGKVALRAEFGKQIEEAKKAADEGTASWWQLLLLAASGYPIGRIARQKLFPLKPANGA